MKFNWIALAAAMTLTAPAFAESHGDAMMAPTGDADAGEAAFRQCVACHIVQNDEGETLAGRRAQTGPNLYQISGRSAGTVEDFRYSDAMVAAGEAGLVWNEETFSAYVQDPTGYLREFLDDSGARGKMAFRVRKEEDAVNLYAYLASLSPAEDMMEEAPSTN
ncbi:c-type cytochrome [Parasulfitobacter algicola]|uniref:Cytochrome C n=1 Tax=Parasulfitobacter algicola TaxID=2614809 RepID=A0ABX2IKR3_9RHOB|nr:cytochrome C [Sulfitobacter algicola]NSX53449.1 cytochrome C [Sulfitobacter algicola]